MLYRSLAFAGIAALILAARAWAGPPPQEAQPLSRILHMLEQAGGIAYFDEIEWDDDGYWEVRFRDSDDRKVKIKVDPVSGGPWRR